MYPALLERDDTVARVTDHAVGVGMYLADPDVHRLKFSCETMTGVHEGTRVVKEAGAPSIPVHLEPFYD